MIRAGDLGQHLQPQLLGVCKLPEPPGVPTAKARRCREGAAAALGSDAGPSTAKPSGNSVGVLG